MSKEKFTQGEWSGLLNEEEASLLDCGGNIIADFTVSHCDEGEMDANVILCAAAPDMYNELKSLRAFLFGMTAYSEGSRLMAINQRILNIDDKLSKARGE